MFVVQHMLCIRGVINYYNIIFVTDKYCINQIVKKSCIIVQHMPWMRYVIFFLYSYTQKIFLKANNLTWFLKYLRLILT